MRYSDHNRRVCSVSMAVIGLLLVSACGASPPPAAPAQPATTRILAMTETGSDFVMLKERPDGSQVLCFYENWDDHKPLGAEGCAPVPPQEGEQQTVALPN
jgi:hypothetical protein